MTDINDMTLEELAERIRSSAPHAYLRIHKSEAGWTAFRGEIGVVSGIAGQGRTLIEALRAVLHKIEWDANVDDGGPESEIKRGAR